MEFKVGDPVEVTDKEVKRFFGRRGWVDEIKSENGEDFLVVEMIDGRMVRKSPVTRKRVFLNFHQVSLVQ